MNIQEAFAARREDLLHRLHADNAPSAAADAVRDAFSRMASELALAEEDALLRQCRQAVMAQLLRDPGLLQCAQADARILLQTPKAEENTVKKLRPLPAAAGAFLLAGLALAEFLNGKSGFALVAILGGVLLYFGALRLGIAPEKQYTAEGTVRIDPDLLCGQLEEQCRAADLCVSDLHQLLLQEQRGQLSGTVDEATLELLSGLLELRSIGRPELALRGLDRVEETLHRMGIEAVTYTKETAGMFDLLPTLSEARTIRPALVRDGQVLRRGTAACRAERRVGA